MAKAGIHTGYRRVRKFDGKDYYQANYASNKKDAQLEASSWRKRGRLARITEAARGLHGYHIWVRS